MRALPLPQLRQLARPCDYGDFYEDIASSIVVHALGDWQAYAESANLQECDDEYRRVLERLKFKSPRQELLEFFRGEWCRYLVESLNVNYEFFLRKNGINYDQRA